jgi:hypothetical protein
MCSTNYSYLLAAYTWQFDEYPLLVLQVDYAQLRKVSAIRGLVNQQV